MKIGIGLLAVATLINFMGHFVVLAGAGRGVGTLIVNYAKGLKEYLEANYVHK